MAKLNQILMGLALLLCATPLAAQSCYVQLDDATGLPLPASQLAELEAAACELRDAFPVEFQGDFAVYDFGFYLHQEGFAGGVPEVFQAKVAEVESESAYFLLFGRQLSRGGGTSEVWVEVRLPEGGAYPCADASQAAVVRGIVQQRLRDSGGSPLNGLRPALEQAKGAINKIYHCCSGTNFRSGTPQTCEASLEDVAVWLSGAGFLDYEGLAIDIADADYQGIDSDKSIVVHLDYRCPLRLQGVTRLDLTDEIEAFVAEMAGQGASSSVKVRYYTDSTAVNFFTDYLSGADEPALQSGGADYTEEVFILDFGGGSVEVYFAFEFGGPEGDPSLGMRASAAGLPGWAKSAIRFFFDRAATNPTTVIIGVTAEYVVEATVEYWFNQNAHDDWLDALWAVGVRRGLKGLAVTLAENVINSRATDFVADIAKYYIDTPYDQWSPAQALVQAGLNTVMGALLPEGVKAVFPKAGALAEDIASKPGLVVDMLWDRRLVGAWEVLYSDLPQHLRHWRTDIAHLKLFSNSDVSSALSWIKVNRPNLFIDYSNLSPGEIAALNYYTTPSGNQINYWLRGDGVLPDVEWSLEHAGRYLQFLDGAFVKLPHYSGSPTLLRGEIRAFSEMNNWTTGQRLDYPNFISTAKDATGDFFDAGGFSHNVIININNSGNVKAINIEPFSQLDTELEVLLFRGKKLELQGPPTLRRYPDENKVGEWTNNSFLSGELDEAGNPIPINPNYGTPDADKILTIDVNVVD